MGCCSDAPSRVFEEAKALEQRQLADSNFNPYIIKWATRVLYLVIMLF